MYCGSVMGAKCSEATGLSAPIRSAAKSCTGPRPLALALAYRKARPHKARTR